jgi:hypothetical protein
MDFTVEGCDPETTSAGPVATPQQGLGNQKVKNAP